MEITEHIDTEAGLAQADTGHAVEHEHASEHAVAHARVDTLELRMADAVRSGALPVVELPVAHTFTPGMYRRTILMRAGTMLTSRIHRTEHQYAVLTGTAAVYIPGQGVELVQAPRFGITSPGTRRVLYIYGDCVWATFHPTTAEEDAEPDETKRLAMIEARIIERRELPDGSGQTAFELYTELLDKAQAAGLLGSAPAVEHAAVEEVSV